MQAVRTTCDFGSVYLDPGIGLSLTNVVLPVLRKATSSGSLWTTSSLVSVGMAEINPKEEESESDTDI